MDQDAPLEPIEELPTPLAQVAARLQGTSPSDPSSRFLAFTYLSETTIKLMAIALLSDLDQRDSESAYRHTYSLLRDNGLGSWEQAISEVAIGSGRNHTLTLCGDSASWLDTKRTGERASPAWLEARDAAMEIVQMVDDHSIINRPERWRDVLKLLVWIRNKTKAHGAYDAEWFEGANALYEKVLRPLLYECPLWQLQWLLIRHHTSEQVRMRFLAGADPKEVMLTDEDVVQLVDGLYLAERAPNSEAVDCSTCVKLNQLVESSSEGYSFQFANGGFSEARGAEFIDYSTGRKFKNQVRDYERPPARLPRSETGARLELEIQGNTLSNLPEPLTDYVRRPKLEMELRKSLVELAHPVITLHGRGGIGKTSLALRVAHDLAQDDPPPFESIIWMSSRDVDLLPSGPSPVDADFGDLEQAAAILSRWISTPPTLDGLIEALANAQGDQGTLFIFDNFESLEQKVAFQKFLGENVRQPNKVVITTRERGFTGDYRINVSGMERNEAAQLLRSVARQSDREGLFDAETIGKIFDVAEGHAYVMRLLASEIIATGRVTGLKSIVGRSDQITDAVFDRSFRQLSDSGRAVFLTVGNWRSVVPEVALGAVLGQREIDVLSGLQEATRLSLLDEVAFSNGEPAYSAPQLARVFAERKLRGATDAMTIRSDLDQLRAFKVIPIGEESRFKQEEVIGRFEKYALDQCRVVDEKRRQQLDVTLEAVARGSSSSWRQLVEFRRRSGMSDEKLLETVRLALEHRPDDIGLLEERRRLARRLGLDEENVVAEIELVEADPHNLAVLERAAGTVLHFVSQHKDDIPPWKRETYVKDLRQAMSSEADHLSASGLSKLAWLYLVENREDEAWQFNELSLKKNRNLKVALNLREKMLRDGYRPSGGMP